MPSTTMLSTTMLSTTMLWKILVLVSVVYANTASNRTQGNGTFSYLTQFEKSTNATKATLETVKSVIFANDIVLVLTFFLTIGGTVFIYFVNQSQVKHFEHHNQRYEHIHSIVSNTSPPPPQVATVATTAT